MAEHYLTIAAIEAKYPNLWVLLSEVRSDRYGNTLGGYVFATSYDRYELYPLIEQLPVGSHSATINTGVRPWVVGPAVTLTDRLVSCVVAACLFSSGAAAGWIARG